MPATMMSTMTKMVLRTILITVWVCPMLIRWTQMAMEGVTPVMRTMTMMDSQIKMTTAHWSGIPISKMKMVS